MAQESGVGRVGLSTGVELAWESRGPAAGSPVVLLHAWGESRGVFDRLLPLLPRTVRAYAVDQRGHGDASQPASGYSLDELAQDVVAFMDVVGLGSAVLLGSSSGGYVAQEVAVRAPDRVAGLVLVGSPRKLPRRAPFADEVERLSDPVDVGWVRESLSWFPLLHDVPASYLDARVADGARIPAHVWKQSLEGLCAAAPPTDSGTITAPTLVLWGAQDDVLDRQQEEDLVRAIPGSRLVAYEGTGHLVLWEQPERVARDLADFMRSRLDG